jgi:transcription antitermination factor NusG
MSRGLEASCPAYREARRWSDRVKVIDVPLFRGYVFARFNPTQPLIVLTSPGVCRIVGIGSIPAPVDDAEMEVIQAVARSDMARIPVEYVAVGQKVIVSQGPLRGSKGILARIKNVDRFVVSISLLQRSVMVEVPSAWIQPAGDERTLVLSA